MKELMSYFIFLVLFIFGVLLFTPKAPLYYGVEKEILKKENIQINEKEVEENYLGFNVKDMEVYFDGLKILNINNLYFNTYLFETKLSIEKVKTQKDIEKIIEGEIYNLDVIHSMLEPKILKIKGQTSLGEIKGFVQLDTKYIRLELKPKEGYIDLTKIKQYFKLEKGIYVYESNKR